MPRTVSYRQVVAKLPKSRRWLLAKVFAIQEGIYASRYQVKRQRISTTVAVKIAIVLLFKPRHGTASFTVTTLVVNRLLLISAAIRPLETDWNDEQHSIRHL